MSDRETKVRERAHQLWEREGRPHGREHDHWAQASHEIDAEESIPAAKKKAAPRPRKSAPAAGSDGSPKPARKKRSTK